MSDEKSNWDYYVPDGLLPKAPVVVVLHGGGQNKDQILDPLRVSPTKEWLREYGSETVKRFTKPLLYR